MPQSIHHHHTKSTNNQINTKASAVQLPHPNRPQFNSKPTIPTTHHEPANQNHSHWSCRNQKKKDWEERKIEKIRRSKRKKESSSCSAISPGRTQLSPSAPSPVQHRCTCPCPSMPPTANPRCRQASRRRKEEEERSPKAATPPSSY